MIIEIFFKRILNFFGEDQNMKIGVAIDLGTSGFRAHKIDLESGKIKKTVITLRNPLPGANVMDHLDFAIRYGLDKAHELSITAVKNILAELGVNPTGDGKIFNMR